MVYTKQRLEFCGLPMLSPSQQLLLLALRVPGGRRRWRRYLFQLVLFPRLESRNLGHFTVSYPIFATDCNLCATTQLRSRLCTTGLSTNSGLLYLRMGKYNFASISIF